MGYVAVILMVFVFPAFILMVGWRGGAVYVNRRRLADLARVVDNRRAGSRQIEHLKDGIKYRDWRIESLERSEKFLEGQLKFEKDIALARAKFELMLIGEQWVGEREAAIAKIADLEERLGSAPTRGPRAPSAELRARIIERDGGVCRYCGEYVGEACHIDHVYPYHKGGETSYGNLVVSCPGCNMAKNGAVGQWPLPLRNQKTTPLH